MGQMRRLQVIAKWPVPEVRRDMRDQTPTQSIALAAAACGTGVPLGRLMITAVTPASSAWNYVWPRTLPDAIHQRRVRHAEAITDTV